MTAEGAEPLAAVRVVRRDGVVVAAIAGEVDVSNADAVLAALTDAGTGAEQGLVVDLAATDYLDSTWPSLVGELARRMAERSRPLRLAVPPEALVARVVRMTRIDLVAPVDGDVEEAVAALRGVGARREGGGAEAS